MNLPPTLRKLARRGVTFSRALLKDGNLLSRPQPEAVLAPVSYRSSRRRRRRKRLLLKVPNSRHVRTNEMNSLRFVRRLGTIIQSIFCAQSEAGIRLNFWKWSGESRYPGALSSVMKTFVPPFLPTRLTAPGSPRMQGFSRFSGARRLGMRIPVPDFPRNLYLWNLQDGGSV